MKRKLVLALAVISALGVASSGAFAQSDEGKQETKPKPEFVAEGDEGFPKGSAPELIAAGDESYPEGSTTPELIG